jgi:alpha-1,2-mannosyltransferase
MATNSGHWMTAKRLRAQGALLTLCLWSLYLWTTATPGLRDRNGNLKGTDFLHLYTFGSLSAAHRGADLYDVNAQAALAAERVPEASGIRYLPLYPPQVSIFFAPLAHLSYAWALIVWWSCSAAVYALCCYCFWRVSPNLRDQGGTVALLAAAYPAFFHLIAWGQTSAVALACFTAMFFLLRDRKNFLAGLVCGCLIFKPQLGVAAAVVFISIGAWKTIAGAALSAAAQLELSVLYYGIEPLHQWLRMVWNVRSVWPQLEPKPYQTHSLQTFWSMLLPWPAITLGLYVVNAAVVLGLTTACWKRSTALPLSLRYSTLLLATVLVAPHLTVYDLVILAPAFILLADWLAGQLSTRSTRWLGTLLYLVYTLPLLGPFTRWTHVQLSVVAMAAMVWLLWKISQSGDAPSARIVSTSEAPRGLAL